MSVYVDRPLAQFRAMVMCHMLADSTQELLEMADRIGVDRKWIQKVGTAEEHFDICKSKRLLAIQHGAEPVSNRKIVELIRARRPSGRRKR